MTSRNRTEVIAVGSNFLIVDEFHQAIPDQYNKAAMIDALDEGRLAAAVLNVFRNEPQPKDNPLWSHPKVRATAHTSYSGNDSHLRWEQLFLENLIRFVNRDPLVIEVDPRNIN